MGTYLGILKSFILAKIRRIEIAIVFSKKKILCFKKLYLFIQFNSWGHWTSGRQLAKFVKAVENWTILANVKTLHLLIVFPHVIRTNRPKNCELNRIITYFFSKYWIKTDSYCNYWPFSKNFWCFLWGFSECPLLGRSYKK